MPKVTIQSGNTLTGIAKGTGYTPQQLAAYNMIEDPNKIRVGQDIFIPYSRQEFESFAGPMAQPAQATAPVQSVAPPQPVVQTRQAQVVDPIKKVTDVSQIKSPEVDALFDKHLQRLGYDTPEAREQLYRLAVNIGTVESSGRADAYNKPQEGKTQSSATGLYQFLTGKGTANEGQKNSSLHGAVNRAKRTVNSPWLEKFTPDLQDKIMIERIKRKRKLDIDDLAKTGLTQDVLDKLAKEFASIPYSKKGFKSYYGQPSKQAIDIIKQYNKSLSR